MSLFRLRFLIPFLLLSAFSCDSKKTEPAKPHDPAASYREKASGKDLYAVLNQQIQNHDPLEKVQKLLGPGAKGEASSMEVTQRFASSHPDNYPEGVQVSDTFIEYKMDEAGKMTIPLQFRDQLLVNHNQAAYASFETISSIPDSQPQSAPSSAPATSTATSSKE